MVQLQNLIMNPLQQVKKGFINHTPRFRRIKQEPKFYCTLCSSLHSFEDLIDGKTCPRCLQDLFLKPCDITSIEN